MIYYFFKSIVYPLLFLFLDIFFQGFFHNHFLYFIPILIIQSLVKKASLLYFAFLIFLLLLESSLTSTVTQYILLLWIPIFMISRYIQSMFLDKPLFPYLVLSHCLATKILMLRLIFNIENSDWLYTIGQFIGNIVLLSFSLK